MSGFLKATYFSPNPLTCLCITHVEILLHSLLNATVGASLDFMYWNYICVKSIAAKMWYCTTDWRSAEATEPPSESSQFEDFFSVIVFSTSTATQEKKRLIVNSANFIFQIVNKCLSASTWMWKSAPLLLFMILVNKIPAAPTFDWHFNKNQMHFVFVRWSCCR